MNNSKSQAKPRIIQNSKLLIQNSVQRTAKFLFNHLLKESGL